MYKRNYRKRNTTLKKAKYTATNKQDKLQNTVLTKLSRQVAKLKASPERKYLDTTAQYNVSTTGQVLLLTDIGVGTSDNSRIGDSVKLTSMNLKIDINLTGTPITSVSQIRFILFRLKDNLDNYSVNPQILDILSAQTMISPHKPETSSPYGILYDRVHQLSAVQIPQKLIRINKLLHHSACRWNTSLTLNNPTNGHIFLAMFSDQVLTPVNAIIYSRIRFIDT